MRTRTYLVVGVAAAAAVTGLAGARLLGRGATYTFTTIPASTGLVSRSILTTGTLQPLTTIQIGSQVSGTIDTVRVDFNSLVRKGEVLARIQPATFQAALDAARAGLAAARAQLEHDTVTASDARTKLAQSQRLFDTGVITESDYVDAQAAARQADAQVAASQSQVTTASVLVEQARVNLDHTIIRSPVDGLVVSRNVDPGQTVAASVQTPVLFLVAPDLKRMQLAATIDEADVGGVHAGDTARFTVDAYPDAVFEGRVSQVRLDPQDESGNAAPSRAAAAAAVGTSASNTAASTQASGTVVAYDAIIGVDNAAERLRPGMTATITLSGLSHDHVLRIPNAALSFEPPAPVLRQTAAVRRAAGEAGDPHRAWIWIVDGTGKPRQVAIQTGLSDDRFTEVAGGDLRAGDRVMIAAKPTS